MKKYFNASIFILIIFLFSQSYAEEYLSMQFDEKQIRMINNLIDIYGKERILYQIIEDDNNTLHVNIKNRLSPSPYPLSRTNKKYIDAYSIYYDTKQYGVSLNTLSEILEQEYPEKLEQKRLERRQAEQKKQRLEQLRQETNQLLKTIRQTAYDYPDRSDDIKLVKQYLSNGYYEEAYNLANSIINKQNDLKEQERLEKERQAELEIERLEQERLEKERQYKVRDEVLQLLITIDKEAYDYPDRNNDIELAKQYLRNNEYDNAIKIAQMIYSNQITLKTQERLKREKEAQLEQERLKREKKAEQVKLEIERSDKARQATLEIERRVLFKKTIYQCLISLALIIIIFLRRKIINLFKRLLSKLWKKIADLLKIFLRSIGPLLFLLLIGALIGGIILIVVIFFQWIVNHIQIICLIIGGCTGVIIAFFIFKAIFDESEKTKEISVILSIFSIIICIYLIFDVNKNSTQQDDNIISAKTNNNQMKKDWTTIFEDSKETVVIIDHPSGLGSGFFINDNVIITNFHVVEDAPVYSELVNNINVNYSLVSITIYQDSKKYDGVVFRHLCFSEYDIAFIITQKDVQGKILKFNESPQIGEDVAAIGCPQGYDFTITNGLISAIRPGVKGISIIQTNAAINSGNSGGPLIDSYGNIVGIVTLKLKGIGIENIAFAISIKSVMEIFSRNNKELPYLKKIFDKYN